jgi:hypothetical protein
VRNIRLPERLGWQLYGDKARQNIGLTRLTIWPHILIAKPMTSGRADPSDRSARLGRDWCYGVTRSADQSLGPSGRRRSEACSDGSEVDAATEAVSMGRL